MDQIFGKRLWHFWIALSGLWYEWTRFPGRCPGLTQDAPLGRNNWKLRFAGKPEKTKKCLITKTAPKAHPKRPKGAKQTSPGHRPGNPRTPQHNEPCRGNPNPHDATKTQNHPARFQIEQGGFRIKNATNIIRPRRNWPDIDR